LLDGSKEGSVRSRSTISPNVGTAIAVETDDQAAGGVNGVAAQRR
jgi:hypothetical protein